MIPETERGSNWFRCVENWLWKWLWNCRKREQRINEEKSLERDAIRIAGYEQLSEGRTTAYDPVGRNPCPGIHCMCITRNVFLCDNSLITTRSDVNLKTPIVRCESLISVSSTTCCRGRPTDRLHDSVLETWCSIHGTVAFSC